MIEMSSNLNINNQIFHFNEVESSPEVNLLQGMTTNKSKDTSFKVDREKFQKAFEKVLKEEKEETREEVENVFLSFSSEYVTKIIKFVKNMFLLIVNGFNYSIELLKLAVKCTIEFGNLTCYAIKDVFNNCKFNFTFNYNFSLFQHVEKKFIIIQSR